MFIGAARVEKEPKKKKKEKRTIIVILLSSIVMARDVAIETRFEYENETENET